MRCRCSNQPGLFITVQHRRLILPCDEDDLALLAPLLSTEVVVVDAVPAVVVGGEGVGEVSVADVGLAELVHHDLLLLLVDLEDDEAVGVLVLELQEFALAVFVHGNPGRHVGLHRDTPEVNMDAQSFIYSSVEHRNGRARRHQTFAEEIGSSLNIPRSSD